MDIYTENIWIGERFNNQSEKLYIDDIPKCVVPEHTPQVLLIRGDSLSIADTLAQSKLNPCVLNFANNDIAGGGYSCKGTTQEEVLLKRMTLGGTLPERFYPIDTVEDKYQYWDYTKIALIYSPEVYVVRNERYELLPEFYKTAVITCAAINNPRTAGGRYANACDRSITQSKIQMILDTAISRGHKNLIAGQWGCGAFGNPLEICELWVEEIARRDIKVVFPVFSNAFGDTMRELLAEYKK